MLWSVGDHQPGCRTELLNKLNCDLIYSQHWVDQWSFHSRSEERTDSYYIFQAWVTRKNLPEKTHFITVLQLKICVQLMRCLPDLSKYLRSIRLHTPCGTCLHPYQSQTSQEPKQQRWDHRWWYYPVTRGSPSSSGSAVPFAIPLGTTPMQIKIINRWNRYKKRSIPTTKISIHSGPQDMMSGVSFIICPPRASQPVEGSIRPNAKYINTIGSPEYGFRLPN